jgi:hypothetical protein
MHTLASILQTISSPEYGYQLLLPSMQDISVPVLPVALQPLIVLFHGHQNPLSGTARIPVTYVTGIFMSTIIEKTA